MPLKPLIRSIVAFALIASSGAIGAEPPATANIQNAIQKSVTLLQTSAADYIDQKTCFSCHHQALPAMVMPLARQRGFVADTKAARAQSAYTQEFFSKREAKLLKGEGVPGGPYNSGYALLSLAKDKWPADKTTAALITYLLKTQKKQGHWINRSKRPPLEFGDFTSTALAVRGFLDYATDAQKPDTTKRIARALKWMTETKPKTTEDHVFRLSGLRWAGAKAPIVKEAFDALRSLQRKDGGWGQLPDMKSDAYATGSAMTILSEAGVDTSGDAYQKGATFLLKTQLDDGSWHVKSRSKPFQKYFESGYPHENDQFISISAGSWATMALLRAQPVRNAPVTADPK